MTQFYFYVALALTWGEPAVSVEAGPYIKHETPESHELWVEPLTMTWSPDEGFGAQSRAQVYLAGEP